MTIKIEKLAQGRLKISDSSRLKDAIEIVDALEEKGLEFHASSVDGWEYIYDPIKEVVYWATDYGHSMWRELRQKGLVTLTPHENTKDNYDGYEWNEGRKWRTVGKPKRKVTMKRVTKK
jgi:hypothetical protein